MKDLTDGSIAKNILQMAVPIMASVALQACLSLWLLRAEFRRRLPAASAACA
jgi:hypothetical protein